MPIELYLKIMDIFIKYYKEPEMGSRLAVDIQRALCPICKKIEKGDYDLEGDE